MDNSLDCVFRSRASAKNSTREIVGSVRCVYETPPSAELAPDQTDQDNLPPYEELDDIIVRSLEIDLSVVQILAPGYAENDVSRVVRLIELTESNRRQAPVGASITTRGFGRHRSYLIS